MRLHDHVAIVTGGAREIGFVISDALVQDGCDLIIADKDGTAADRAASELAEKYGRNVQGICVDVSDEVQVSHLFDEATNLFGKVTILVNNAGIMGPVDETQNIDVKDWDATMNINLRGMFLCSKHVIPIMKEQKSGNIVNIASVTGKRPLPLRLAYATSKMGVIGFTRSLAAEIGQYGIRVNSVCPGSVIGSRQKHVFEGIMKATGKSYEEVAKDKAEVAALKSFVDPKYIANLVSFLCSDDSWAITGQDINVCAGAVMF